MALRILTFSNLFPNSEQPSLGVFVENRLRKLVGSGQVQSRVVAPVPWFPSTNPRFGEKAGYARVPASERRHGLEISHPRWLQLPKLMSLAPLTMYLSLRGPVRRLLEQQPVDLIDAHYFFPDGVAAVLLAREFNLPVTITGRGTDLNLIPKYALPRREIRWAAQQADGLITVCAALAEPLVEMGIPREKVTVLRNGVDLNTFRPQPRDAARAALGLTGPTLLSVGWLIQRKGHHIIIDAMTRLPGVTLLIAGSGPDRAALEAQVARLGLQDRIRFLGQVSQAELPGIYSAADALVLASDREGWANVLLESMACGTPVIASDVWGTAEAVTAPEAGRLFFPLEPEPLATAARSLLAALPDRTTTRAYAERYSWDATTQGQIDLFTRIIERRKAAQRR